MPCFGLTSFLQEVNMKIRKKATWCQCPASGLLHFYTVSGIMMKKLEKRVNALLRAYFISTK